MYRTYGPSLVSGLVLIDTRADPDSPEAAQKRLTNVRLLQESQSTKFLADAMVPTMLSPATLKESTKGGGGGGIVDYVRSTILENKPAGVIDALHMLRTRPDSTPLLRTLAVPVLFVFGKDDALTGLDIANKMKELVDDASSSNSNNGIVSKLEVIHDAGHLSPIEQPDVFNAVLSNFLDAIEGNRHRHH